VTHIWPPELSLRASGSSSRRPLDLEAFGTSLATACFWPRLYAVRMVIGTLTTFSIADAHPQRSGSSTNAALLTYVIPASFLAIPSI